MLDYDLAAIYGYTTSAFNQQVARNREKFIGRDFMFKLSKQEIQLLLISQNVTSKIQKGIKVTVVTNNTGHYLTTRDYQDFRKEFPEIKINFVEAGDKIHDRFIALDCGESTERIFLCGASSKDAGNKMTMIMELKENVVTAPLRKRLLELLNGPELKL